MAVVKKFIGGHWRNPHQRSNFFHWWPLAPLVPGWAEKLGVSAAKQRFARTRQHGGGGNAINFHHTFTLPSYSSHSSTLRSPTFESIGILFLLECEPNGMRPKRVACGRSGGRVVLMEMLAAPWSQWLEWWVVFEHKKKLLK